MHSLSTAVRQAQPDAHADDGGPFQPHSQEAEKGRVKAGEREDEGEGGQAKGGSATYRSKQTFLGIRCRNACRYSGKRDSPAYQTHFKKVVEANVFSCAHQLTPRPLPLPLRKLRAAFNYLVYGSHHCKHCDHLLSLLQLSTAGRKRLGITHNNVTPFNRGL